jgi:Protein of unknown function (DUF4232)
MRISKRTAGRVAALAAGVAAAASVAAAVSATAFARTTPSRPAASAACPARDLALRLVGTDTGVGTTALTVAISSHASQACVVGGYPSLSLLRADGAPQPAAFSRGRGTWFAGLRDQAVRLAPGGQASFFITYRDFNPATGHPGPAVTALRAGLPGVPGRFTVPARFAPYGGISVSPIRAGARKE